MQDCSLLLMPRPDGHDDVGLAEVQPLFSLPERRFRRHAYFNNLNAGFLYRQRRFPLTA